MHVYLQLILAVGYTAVQDRRNQLEICVECFSQHYTLYTILHTRDYFFHCIKCTAHFAGWSSVIVVDVQFIKIIKSFIYKEISTAA